MTATVRWLTRQDLGRLVGIETERGDTTIELQAHQWRRSDFLRALEAHHAIGLVADIQDRVAGFMIYRPRRFVFEVLKLKVIADSRRRGIGTQLVTAFLAQHTRTAREWASMIVPERNLPAQLFLKNNGFRATAIVRDDPRGDEGNAYLMRRRILGSSAQRKCPQAACSSPVRRNADQMQVATKNGFFKHFLRTGSTPCG